jgi:hypothetical protein
MDKLCMGLFRWFWCTTPGLDITDNGLPTSVNVDMLNSHFLLTLAAMFVEGFHVQRIGSGKSIGAVEVHLPAFDGLLLQHRAATTLHRSAVASNHLAGKSKKE